LLILLCGEIFCFPLPIENTNELHLICLLSTHHVISSLLPLLMRSQISLLIIFSPQFRQNLTTRRWQRHSERCIDIDADDENENQNNAWFIIIDKIE
jgi:hypothetical protein